MSAEVADEIDVTSPYRPVVVFAICIVLLGVFASGVLAVGLPPGDASPEAGFARDMGVHHAQAVEMADIVRDRTSDPEVRYLAIDIALGQQAQIGQMQGWLAVWGLPARGVEPQMTWMGHEMASGTLMPGMAALDELALLRDAPSDKVDAVFLQLMIRHHRGGVDMAEGVLSRTRQPEVRSLAQVIVDGQTAEITAMSDLLRRKGAVIPGEQSAGMGIAMSGHTMMPGRVRINSAVFRDVVLYAPVGLGAFAAAWLIADAMRQRQAPHNGPTRVYLRSEGIHALAVGGLALGAALHLGLWPTYALGQPGTNALFGLSALGMAASGGVTLARPSAPALAAGSALTLLAISTFFVLRLGPSLTGTAPLPLDVVELIAVAVDFVALASCAVLGLSGPTQLRGITVDIHTGTR